MGAGDLRDTITVTRLSRVSDGRGGTVPDTTVIASAIPAAIVTKRGGEQVQAQRLSGVTAYDITVRYDEVSATITATDTITDDAGTVYAIVWTGCLDVGRKRWLTIMATTGSVANR